MKKQVKKTSLVQAEKALKELSKKIKEILNLVLKEGTIAPIKETTFQWKVRGFSYSKEGANYKEAQGTYSLRNLWWGAIHEIKKDIEKTSEYEIARSFLIENFENDTENKFNLFLERFVNEFLTQKDLKRKFNTSGFIKRFINDLLNKPIKYVSEIQLMGLVLENKKVNINWDRIVLRQTTASDLEIKFPLWDFRHSNINTSSAISNIIYEGRNPRELQLRIERMVALLRLFQVGSVFYQSYQMCSNSSADKFGSSIHHHPNYLMTLVKSLINKTKENKLKLFFKTLGPLLPQRFYHSGEGEVTPITIAYERYCDSLLRTSIFEERVANAVMGLEGLFLTENLELSYRLRTLVAKSMSLLGFDPIIVRDTMKDAYLIRSKFAHGDHLSNSKKKAYDSKYEGDIGNLLLKVLDFLRIQLVIMIIINLSKNDFVSMLEDSLFDQKTEEKLKKKYTKIKAILA